MDYLSEKRKRQIFVVVFIYFSFIALSIILLILRNPNELKAQYIINCAVDIFGMIMGYVLFICSLIDVQRTGERNLYFFIIIRKREKLKRYQFVALLLYIFLPMAVYIFTVFSYGLSVSYGVIMVVLLLMYCVINISQGRDKVTNGVNEFVNGAEQFDDITMLVFDYKGVNG